MDEKTWVLLSTHQKKWEIKVNNIELFTSFRLTQTGKNTYNDDHLAE